MELLTADDASAVDALPLEADVSAVEAVVTTVVLPALTAPRFT